MSILINGSDLSYGTPDQRVLAAGIDFELSAGEILLVKGPNGVGKTTFLRTLLGKHRKLSGRLDCNTEPSKIGYLPQLQNLAFHLPVTLGDVLRVAPGYAERKTESIGLLQADQLRLNWNTASGGERKRALLTRALQAEPKLLLLDEPFNHLDRATKLAVTTSLLDFLRTTNGGIVMVSHESDETDLRAAGITIRELTLGL